MSSAEPARERIARQLQDAVEQLRHDMEKVEFWTEVLSCLSRPAPDYSAGTDILNRFALPQRGSDDTARMGDLDSKRSAEKAEISQPGKPTDRGQSRH